MIPESFWCASVSLLMLCTQRSLVDLIFSCTRSLGTVFFSRYLSHLSSTSSSNPSFLGSLRFLDACLCSSVALLISLFHHSRGFLFRIQEFLRASVNGPLFNSAEWCVRPQRKRRRKTPGGGEENRAPGMYEGAKRGRGMEAKRRRGGEQVNARWDDLHWQLLRACVQNKRSGFVS